MRHAPPRLHRLLSCLIALAGCAPEGSPPSEVSDPSEARVQRPGGALVSRTAAWGRPDAPIRGTAGIEAWWRQGQDGPQQGWTLDAPPAGEGPLFIDVEIEDATLTVGDGELWLRGPEGLGWTIRGLAAWDADGVTLDARFERTEGGFRVVVEDAGARYPLTVDPIYTYASAAVTGESIGMQVGSAVADAGDVNGDGYGDVIVAATGYSDDTGRVTLHLGSASGINTTASATLTGEATGALFGSAIDGAGDVNGDGYDDVIVSSTGLYPTASTRGRVYIFHGSASGLATTAATTIDGDATTTFGDSVAGVGDVDGDGYDDVVIGAAGFSSRTGKANLHLGSASGVSSTVSVTFTGEATSSYFGEAVAGAGDVNADGYDDILVGAYSYGSSIGRVYVYHGAASGPASTASLTLSGEITSSNFGRSVAGAGDVNGDGYDDIIVGANTYSSSTGRAYIYVGSASGLSSAAHTTLDGESTASYFGWDVSGAGDVNGDGYDDVIVGADRYSAYTGRAYLFEGSASGVSTTESATLDAASSFDYFGWAVSGAGDVNGDGYDDVIVGAYYYSSRKGQATIYHGYIDADGDGYAAVADCDDLSDAAYPGADETVADGVDQDCDGVDTCYTDADEDGFGAATTTDGSGLDCVAGSGAAVSTDCDDEDAAAFPGADEAVADGVDQDCDALDDCFVDEDGDNYGTSAVITGSSLDCASGTGAAVSTDCDDAAAAVNPGQRELCDASDTDEDCDGLADDADGDATAATKSTVYVDADGDGFGDTVSAAFCDPPAVGYAASATDCDDTSAAIRPTATEICDALNTDEDCDGLADDADPSTSTATKGTYYVDLDGDGYGSTTATAWCDLPTAGFATLDTDCDDGDSSTRPGADETTGDEKDSDCDGGERCYADADADGYRPDSASTAESTDEDCDDAGEAPDSAPVGDCDDRDAEVNPSMAEGVGDELDQDCDGAERCYADVDDDGARSDAVVRSPDLGCDALGEAREEADLDCDDADATAFPDADEITGSGVDEDCDGGELCFLDDDDDGYRPDETSTVTSADSDCADSGEALLSALTGDCDDEDASYNPGAAEPDCTDPADYNCDGSTGYADADDDGWAACAECDDGDADIYPGATESPGDGVDSDCDGVDRCYLDADDDGYRPDATSTLAGETVACDGPGEASGLDPVGDCDDDDDTVSPAAPELVGDGLDQDCDGGEICLADQDEDGARAEDGSTAVSSDEDCDDAGEALASAQADCDDADDAIHPDADETPGDEVDQDCDDAELCWVDADEDGYRPDATSTVYSADLSCEGAGEARADAPTGDCDDADETVNPSGTELPGDDLDSDCDETELCYLDADDDGYRGDAGETVASSDLDCADSGEALASSLDGDCDDGDDAWHPGAAETDCTDPSDYNCDGSTGYDDLDEDGWAACEECDDRDASVSPDALEQAGDAVDQDCDGTEICYLDADDDGYRPDATSTVSSANIACDGDGEALAEAPTDDCDDADADVNPAASERVGDEIDQDCDGGEQCYVDADGDGYTDGSEAQVASADLTCDGAGEATDDAPAGDCDDADAAYNPGALEEDCEDPADYNCDGSTGAIDQDGDGFSACDECDDATAEVNPDADERCNARDDDCDGTIDQEAVDAAAWYADADEDGYTDPDETVSACEAPEGYAAATEDDCDDDDAGRYPGATETPDDGVDQDCDGFDDVAGSGGDGGGTDTSKSEGCACAAGDASPGLGWLGLLVTLALTRRRR